LLLITDAYLVWQASEILFRVKVDPITAPALLKMDDAQALKYLLECLEEQEPGKKHESWAMKERLAKEQKRVSA